MRLAILGATGNVGRRVLTEAIDRGHQVTVLVRDLSRAAELPSQVRAVVGDAYDRADIESLARGHDAVISALRPPAGREAELAVMTEAMLEALHGTRIRLLVVGGAATLRVPGTDATVLDDSRYLAPEYRGIALACVDQLLACQQAGRQVNWTYLSPAANLHPGPRTGNYRVGTDELLVDAEGNSAISMEDFAVALLDEVQRPRNRWRRFTVAH